MGRKWTNISVPSDMVERAKKIVEEPEIRAKYGYGSVSELVRRVVSDKMDVLEKEIEKGKKRD